MNMTRRGAICGAIASAVGILPRASRADDDDYHDPHPFRVHSRMLASGDVKVTFFQDGAEVVSVECPPTFVDFTENFCGPATLVIDLIKRAADGNNDG